MTVYRSNNSLHGQGEFLNATLFDKANPPLTSKDGNTSIGVNQSIASRDFDSVDGQGLGKKPAYIGNNSVKLNGTAAQKFVNFSTLYNADGDNTFSARTTVISNSWRPKFHDTPKVDVLAQQAAAYKTHWGYMNTIAESKYIRVTNSNKTDSPFEKLANPNNYSPDGNPIENVGNKVRYCFIVPKTVRQGFKARRTSSSHLPSPNFFEQSANIDLKNQLRKVMIPAGASIIIQKNPSDAVVICNLESGHGGGAQNTGAVGTKSYKRNFSSNTMIEPIVLRNS